MTLSIKKNDVLVMLVAPGYEVLGKAAKDIEIDSIKGQSIAIKRPTRMEANNNNIVIAPFLYSLYNTIHDDDGYYVINGDHIISVSIASAEIADLYTKNAYPSQIQVPNTSTKLIV